MNAGLYSAKRYMYIEMFHILGLILNPNVHANLTFYEVSQALVLEMK
jgi:hypothetical protein